MARTLFWMLLLLSLSLLSCKEETILVSSEDSLVDPRVAPKVLYAYPPLNSVGPYVEWNGSYYSSTRFELRFNKLMDVASVKGAFRLASTLRTLTVDSADVSSVNRESFAFVPREMCCDERDYKLGEVLTLSFARPVSDVNGNTIAAGVLGTMQPEPAFRVRRMSPQDGAIIYPNIHYMLTLFFNSRIDASILPFVSVAPALPGSWSFSADSMRLVAPISVSSPVQEFLVSVAAGAPDREGHFTTIPFSARLRAAPFVIQPSWYEGDTLNAPLYRNFDLNCYYPIDSAMFRSALHISPAVPGGVFIQLYQRNSHVSFQPNVEYAPNTRYVVRIDSTLRSSSGFRLSEEFTFAFRTGPFAVSGTYPYNQETGISPRANVMIYTSARLDSSTVRESFTIVPTTAGTLSFSYQSSAFYFYPSGNFLPNTEYVVTVGTSLRSVSGYTLSQPYVFSFTTGGL